MAHTIHIIAGPTASGKSARAIALAHALGGPDKCVIVNCDSLQIYDGLHTLTAQPSSEDHAEIPHALYSHLHPNEVCSAGNWRELVVPLLHTLLAAGKTPIICGGTGLYIRALVDGLSPIPDIPDSVRNDVIRMQADLGNPAFYEELKRRDPIMAERFHPYHKARLMRAMEVLLATGKSLAEWQKLPLEGPPDDWEFQIETIIPERETLYDHCNTRFEKMLESGALEEVKDFTSRIETGEVRDGVPLTKALGFKPLRAYLKGEISRDDAITLSQNETRRYAKRQVTWFKNQL